MKMRSLILRALLLGGASILALADDNKTTTSEMTIKIYVSVGNLKLNHSKTNSKPPAAPVPEEIREFPLSKQPVRRGGIIPGLDYVIQAMDRDGRVVDVEHLKAAGWVEISRDGNTLRMRRPQAAKTSTSSTPPLTGSAAVTIAGVAKVSWSPAALASAVVTLTDILSSDPVLSGDPTLAAQAAQELCNGTASLANQTISLGLSDLSIVLQSKSGGPPLKKEFGFTFFGEHKALPVVIGARPQLGVELGELGLEKKLHKATCSLTSGIDKP
jgi:hypothetical protein